MTPEHIYYNSLAIAFHGNHLKLKKFYKLHRSWSAVNTATINISYDEALGQWQSLEKFGIRLLLAADANFPKLLKEMPWSPHGIYIRGADLTDTPKIAIVGTRRVSQSGLATAESFAHDLARTGLTIVSGLAFGVDAMAHKSTLAAKGKAVAVLASGLNDITPRSNTRLGEQIIASGGTLVSEYPIGTPPLRQFFIERNRIVSGLSLGIVVIEAPARSGTLSTARFALDQNREVLVVPGPITNQNFAGSHALIRSGATLVTSPAEVLSALHLLPEETHTQPLPFLDGTEQRIVELLSTEQKPLTVDTIAERLSLGTAVINEAVALLIIEGIIKEATDSYYL